MRDRDPGLSVALALAAAALLPFVAKPFHVDDPSFLWAARSLSSRPWDPWGHVSVWAGSALPLHVHVNHPPGNAYLLWLGTLVGGESEIALHGLYLGVALAAVVAIHAAARALTARPGLATLAVVCTPAFLVTATTLMADVPYLAAWTASVALWIRGEHALVAGAARRRATLAFAGAALAAALCGAIRYNGIALVPLLAVYSVARRRRVADDLTWLALPVASFAAYQLVFAIQYGHVALLSASTFAAQVKANLGATASRLTIVALVFLGGSAASLACLAPFVWPARVLAATLGGALVAGALFASPLGTGLGLPAGGPDRLALVAQSGLFAVLGALALALALADLVRRRSAESLLLALWVLGTFAFASVLNWAVNVRSLLPALPALAILLVRRIGPDPVADAEAPLTAGAARSASAPIVAVTPLRAGLALAASLALSLAVAAVDLAFAREARRGAELALERARDGGRPLFFVGHWGFQWYLEEGGALPVDLARSNLPSGALLAQPDWVREVPLPPSLFDEVGSISLARPTWSASISHELATNFYANASFGPLPYAFGHTTSGRVVLLQARAEIDVRSAR